MMKLAQYLGLTIVPVALTGTICNGLVVLAISSNRSLHHSFSMLTGIQAVYSGLFSLICLNYVAPMIVFDMTFLKKNSHHAGFLLLLCYDVSIQTLALITVNRFCAVFFPMMYSKLFNSKRTNLIMFLSFFISLTQLTIFFQILPCRFYYNDQLLGFYITDLPICWDYSLYLDTAKLTTICTFNVVVDTITILKVRRIRRAKGKTTFQKKEIDFLKQVAIIGTICNGLVVSAISSNRSLHHSFSMLTGIQAVCNGIFSFFYLIYVTPMIVFDVTFLKENSHHAGFLLLLCYDVSIQTHALITVNRFCAVFLPIVFKNLFNSKWTNFLVLLSFLASLTQLTIFFQILPCRLYYNDQLLGFYYTELPICWDYSLYLDMGKLMLICTFNVVVDTITIWKVRRIRSAQGMTKFQKKEIDFLKQSFGQAIYLFLCIPTYYIIPLFTPNRIVLFLIGIFFWATIHMFDGVLTLYFNLEIRKSLIKKNNLSGNNSVVQIGVVSKNTLL